MNWTIWIVVIGAIAAFIIFKQMSQGPTSVARDYIQRGGKVIDVRNEEEFHARHVAGAINIPLNRLKAEIAQVAPDKEQPILLHCLSGGRSAMGTRILRNMGYRHCVNLGSFARAQKIVTQSAGSTRSSEAR